MCSQSKGIGSADISAERREANAGEPSVRSSVMLGAFGGLFVGMTHLGSQELAGAGWASQLKPQGTTAGLNGEPEAQKRAALALEPDELRQGRDDFRPGRIPESRAVGQPADFLPVPTQFLEKTSATLR